MRFFAAAIIATFAYGIKLQEAATLEEIDEALDLVGATEEERAVLEAKYESLDDDEKAGFREAMGDLRDAHEAGEIDDDDVMDVVGKLRSGELDLDDIEDGVKEHLKKKKQGGDKKGGDKKGGDQSGDEAAEEAAPVEFAQEDEDVTVEDVEDGLDELGATDEEKAALKEKLESLDDGEKRRVKEALGDLKDGLESGEVDEDDVKEVVRKLRDGEIDLDDVKEGVEEHLKQKKQGGDKKKKGGDESGDEAAEEAAPVEFAQEDVTVEDVEAGLDELGATDEEKAALKEKFDSLDDDEKEGLKEALTDLKAGLESGEISADDVKKVVKKLRKGEIDLDDVEEGVRKHLEGKDGKSDDELELAQRV